MIFGWLGLKPKGKQMAPEEKLAIFEKYDFSKTGILRNTGIGNDDPKIQLYHDIAGMVQALMIVLGTRSRG